MTQEEYNEAKAIIRMLVRTREDFQAMRKRMDNRIGRKANGDSQENLTERAFASEDAIMLSEISDAAKEQEKSVEKSIKKALKRMPIYTDFLLDCKGVGTIAAGHICGSFDIYKASTVSKLWQYSGMNSGMVRGKKRVEHKDGSFELVTTNTMIRGDKLASGFVSPFNKELRCALLGVMADGFIKCQNDYCMNYYYPYKERLANETGTVMEISKAGAKAQPIEWRDAKKSHRDRAAKRYMVKMFLKDLYAAWRPMHGLEVRVPYAEEYLGKSHAA